MFIISLYFDAQTQEILSVIWALCKLFNLQIFLHLKHKLFLAGGGGTPFHGAIIYAELFTSGLK